MEVSRKLPSRVGVEKVDREKAKEYCRMAQPKCPPSLRTGDSSCGSVLGVSKRIRPIGPGPGGDPGARLYGGASVAS
jgi:hypothetical protein